MSQLQLTDYNYTIQGTRCSSRTELLIYVHQKYNFTILTNPHQHDKLKCQLVKITGGDLKKYIIILNTYRSPNDLQAHYRQFIDEFTTLLTSLDKSNSEIIITGDFNINLLKLNEKAIFS